MALITMEIKSCRECPKLNAKKVYTADSWEQVEELKCEEKNKIISSYADWGDEIEVPKWCPLRG